MLAEAIAEIQAGKKKYEWFCRLEHVLLEAYEVEQRVVQLQAKEVTLTETVRMLTADRDVLLNHTKQLKAELDETAKTQLAELDTQYAQKTDELQQQYDQEKAQLESRIVELRSEKQAGEQIVAELTKTVKERTAELHKVEDGFARLRARIGE